MKSKILFTFCILMSFSSVYSQTLNFRFGQGSGDTEGKTLSGSYHDFIYKDFVIAEGQIGLLNGDNIQGTDYVLFYEASIGAEIRLPVGIYVKVNQGVALLHRTTNRLDSQLQYPTTISGGLHHKGKHLGIFWKHFSSGKVSRGNRGQEYIGIEVGFKL